MLGLWKSMLTLCAPKPPLRSQKSCQGESAGGTGTGKKERILGFLMSETSMSEAWLGPSAQPPSELVSTIWREGNGNDGVDREEQVDRADRTSVG